MWLFLHWTYQKAEICPAGAGAYPRASHVRIIGIMTYMRMLIFRHKASAEFLTVCVDLQIMNQGAILYFKVTGTAYPRWATAY